MSSPHVPAWKRIGLKLKYAKDTATDGQPQSSPTSAVHAGSTINGFQRKSETLGDSEPPAKRRKAKHETHDDRRPKPAHETNGHASSVENDSISSDSTKPKNKSSSTNGDAQSEPVTEATPKPRRKSVAFTPETKREDGFTAANLGKQWKQQNLTSTEPDQSEQAPTSPTSDTKAQKRKAATDQSPTSDAKSADQKPKVKQQKEKKGSKTKSASTSDPNETPAYIDYLEQFHTNKANWKFNKAKQNDVLKHALDINLIPPQHTEALVSYLSGLQGVAAAKRLFDSATEVLKEIAVELDPSVDYDGMESYQARLDAYRDALFRHLEIRKASGVQESEYEDQAEQERRVKEEKGKRAEAILTELSRKDIDYDAPLTVPTTSHEPTKSAGSANGSTPDAKRKSRKSRTQAASESSDSSSSDSDSDDSSSDSDSSDSGDGTPAQKPSSRTSAASSSHHASRANSSFSNSNNDTTYRGPVRTDIPAAPAYGPSVSGAIPSGFGIGGSGNSQKKKFFDDELLDSVFGKRK